MVWGMEERDGEDSYHGVKELVHQPQVSVLLLNVAKTMELSLIHNIHLLRFVQTESGCQIDITTGAFQVKPTQLLFT